MSRGQFITLKLLWCQGKRLGLKSWKWNVFFFADNERCFGKPEKTIVYNSSTVDRGAI